MSFQRFQIMLFCAGICLNSAAFLAADEHIIPTPQRVVYGPELISLDHACIVTADRPSKAIAFGVQQLNEAIIASGAKPLDVLTASQFGSLSTRPSPAISIGIWRRDAFAEGLDAAKGGSGWMTPEGYTISMNGDVVCRGYDDVGAYYAVQSLIQLILPIKDSYGHIGIRLRHAEIEDWPAFKLRILPNAAWADVDYLKWIARYKFDVGGIHYPNCKEWRSLPAGTWSKIESACKFSEDTGAVRTILYLNPYVRYPGSSPMINLATGDGMDQLVGTFDRFLSSGGKMIALCVDDFFRMSDEERKKFASHSEAQAYLVNQVYTPLKKKHPDMTMIFCPQWYAGVLKDREQTTDPTNQSVNFGKDLGRHYYYLCSHIPKDVLVFWTGPTVRSHEITEEQLLSFAKVAGRKPFYWDNTFYDYHRSAFVENLFDPYPLDDKYPAHFYRYLDAQGIHLNSGASEISKVGFLTAADYFWNPEAFDYRKSLTYALDRVAGHRAAPLLLQFRDAMVDLRLHLKAAGKPESIKQVQDEFDRIKALHVLIKGTCENKALMSELDRDWMSDAQAKISKLEESSVR